MHRVPFTRVLLPHFHGHIQAHESARAQTQLGQVLNLYCEYSPPRPFPRRARQDLVAAEERHQALAAAAAQAAQAAAQRAADAAAAELTAERQGHKEAMAATQKVSA
eukprot:328695-Chlamydomonas_euryale.AAC.3